MLFMTLLQRQDGARGPAGPAKVGVRSVCVAQNLTLMGNNWAEAIEVALQRRGRSGTRLLVGGVLFVLFVLDAAATVLLRQMPVLVAADAVDWQPVVFMRELADFNSAMSDMLLLFAARWILMLSLLFLGLRLGKPRLDDIAAGTSTGCIVITQPLLINGDDNRLPGSGDAPLEHLESHRRKRAADRRKNAVLGVVFGVSTAAQVFVGVKCISFVGAWPQSHLLLTAQGTLLGLTVALINAQSFCVTRLINILTAEEGFHVPVRPARAARLTPLAPPAPVRRTVRPLHAGPVRAP